MRTWFAALAAALLSVAPAAGQDMEPRAYSPSPVGTTFVVAGATRSAGGVFTDPTLPVEDAEATIGVLALAFGHTINIGGRQALVLGGLPITWGEASGEVGEVGRQIHRRGLADPRLKLSVILAGSPAMTPAQFVKAPRRTIVGASLSVVPPLGQYDSTKLINLGSNRWSLKPEIGVSYPRGRWTIDGYAGIWFFTPNHDFFPGTVVRRQDPIVSLQGHLSYTFGRRAWVAFDGTWYSGGKTSLDGIDKADLQRNTRVGVTLALPVGARQSLKFAYSAGATTRIGADFRTIGVAWQMLIF
jgi:Putative MetA-pathway of phenol degradation